MPRFFLILASFSVRSPIKRSGVPMDERDGAKGAAASTGARVDGIQKASVLIAEEGQEAFRLPAPPDLDQGTSTASRFLWLQN
jgi:hypothetical protein